MSAACGGQNAWTLPRGVESKTRWPLSRGGAKKVVDFLTTARLSRLSGRDAIPCLRSVRLWRANRITATIVSARTSPKVTHTVRLHLRDLGRKVAQSVQTTGAAGGLCLLRLGPLLREGGAMSCRKPRPPRRRLRARSKPGRRRHHLDRRIEQIAALAADKSDDDLITTRELAAWLGVSVLWVELGRSKKYGPPFVKLGPRMIRYVRGDVRRWLQSRIRTAT